MDRAGRFPSPNTGTSDDLAGVAIVSANNVWAVGGFQTTSTAGTLVEHWNGSSWKIVPSPNGINSTLLTGVSAASAKDIWAVGVTNFSGSVAFQTFTMHWNGSAWKVVHSPDVAGTQGDFLSAVAVVSSKNVWAVGSSSGAGTSKTTLTLHWNGSSWKIVSSPNVSGAVKNELNGVASAPDDVIAVGDATIVTAPMQSKEVTLVEKYS
jgi:hypothetical protein